MLLGQVTVNHPTGSGFQPGDYNVDYINVSVGVNDIGKRYRLEVTRGPATTTLREAHHYELSFSKVSGVPVDVGINSPTFRYFEPGNEVFHVNVGSNEPLQLAILVDADGFGAPQATSVTVEIDNPSGQLLLVQGGTPPFTVNIPSPGSGTYAVKINANEHYRLDKMGPRQTVNSITGGPAAPPRDSVSKVSATRKLSTAWGKIKTKY